MTCNELPEGSYIYKKNALYGERVDVDVQNMMSDY